MLICLQIKFRPPPKKKIGLTPRLVRGHRVGVTLFNSEHSPRIEGGESATLKATAAGSGVLRLCRTVAVHNRRVPAFIHRFRFAISPAAVGHFRLLQKVGQRE